MRSSGNLARQLIPVARYTIIIHSTAPQFDIIVPFSFNNILTTEGLNSLTFGDPYARLCFTAMLVRAAAASRRSSQNKASKRVIYIDTDTTFTAYLMAGFILRGYDMNPDRKNSDQLLYSKNQILEEQNLDESTPYRNVSTDTRLVQVFLPSEGRFESLLGGAIASMKEASIVILDSLNSFYNMYPTSYQQLGPARQSLREKSEQLQPKKSPYTINRLNHLLSVFIMLLVKHGVYLNIPVLVTSMVRYKKVSEDLWVKSPTCRRLLHQKSVVRLSVEMSGDKDLSVNIMKHPSIAQQTIVYPNAGISLSPEANQSKL